MQSTAVSNLIAELRTPLILMNSSRFRFLAVAASLVWVTSLNSLHAIEFNQKPSEIRLNQVKPRPTHAQLAKRLGAVKSTGKIALAEEPKKLPKIRSDKTEGLLKRSVVISYGKYWTFVPKGAVLHIPKHLKKRMSGERKGKLLPWPTFLVKNRGWIQTQEISMTEARGEAALNEDVVKRFQKSARVVIAVCKKGPISVRPVKADKDENQVVKNGSQSLKPTGK